MSLYFNSEKKTFQKTFCKKINCSNKSFQLFFFSFLLLFGSFYYVTPFTIHFVLVLSFFRLTVFTFYFKTCKIKETSNSRLLNVVTIFSSFYPSKDFYRIFHPVVKKLSEVHLLYVLYVDECVIVCAR